MRRVKAWSTLLQIALVALACVCLLGAAVPLAPAPAIAGSARPAASASDACLAIFGPGYWKNYQNHYSDAQFYNFLIATRDFGPRFAALSPASAIGQAETILKLPEIGRAHV